MYIYSRNRDCNIYIVHISLQFSYLKISIYQQQLQYRIQLMYIKYVIFTNLKVMKFDAHLLHSNCEAPPHAKLGNRLFNRRV